MNVYDKIMEAVCKGTPFRIDLRRHTIRMGKRKAVTPTEDLGLDNITTEDEARQRIKDLHNIFLHSVPTEQEAKHERGYYFKAPKDLSRDDILMGMSRTESRAALELSVLIFSLRGLLTWRSERPGWFINLGDGCIIKREWLVESA